MRRIFQDELQEVHDEAERQKKVGVVEVNQNPVAEFKAELSGSELNWSSCRVPAPCLSGQGRVGCPLWFLQS